MNLALPILSENGQIARVKVTSVGNLWSLAFATDGGRRVEPFGPTYERVADACRDAAHLNARTGQ